MNEKYQIMTLKYFYSVLNLKKYEEKLDNKGFESLIEPNDHFHYFSLLSNGDTLLFTDEEKNELMDFDKYTIDELLENEELINKYFELIKKTYQKYYFSTSKGEYNYYIKTDMDHMVPDDAFALCINYKIPFSDKDNLDTKKEECDDLLTDIINEIQFVDAKNNNIKLAVVTQNEYDLNSDYVLR